MLKVLLLASDIVDLNLSKTRSSSRMYSRASRVKRRGRRDEREGDRKDCIRSEDPRPSSMTGTLWAGLQQEHDWDRVDVREFRASLRVSSMRKRLEKGAYSSCHSEFQHITTRRTGTCTPWLSYGEKTRFQREQSGLTGEVSDLGRMGGQGHFRVDLFWDSSSHCEGWCGPGARRVGGSGGEVHCREGFGRFESAGFSVSRGCLRCLASRCLCLPA